MCARRAPGSSLWRQSPSTLGFVETSWAFERAKRFGLFSIYSRDDVNKQRKVFSLIERPELLVAQFRREIEDAGSSKWRNNNRQARKRREDRGRSRTVMDTGAKQDSMDTTASNRLSRGPGKLRLKYDYFGNRSHFLEDADDAFAKGLAGTPSSKSRLKPSAEEGSQHKPQRRPYIFSLSTRMDLSRPLNFFPGPGSYPQTRPVPATMHKWRSQHSFAEGKTRTQ